jgi:hypothetical protein
MPMGYSGQVVLRREQCDMMTEEESHCLVTARQTHFAATNKHTTMDEFLEVLFSMQSVLRSYNHTNQTDSQSKI